MTIVGAGQKVRGEVPTRSALLLVLASMERPRGCWAIGIGVNADTAYSDCSAAGNYLFGSSIVRGGYFSGGALTP